MTPTLIIRRTISLCAEISGCEIPFSHPSNSILRSVLSPHRSVLLRARTPVTQQQGQVLRADVSVVGLWRANIQTHDRGVGILRDRAPVAQQEGQIERTAVTVVINLGRTIPAIRRELVDAHVNLLFARAPVAEEEGEVVGVDGAVAVEVGWQ